MSDRLLSLAHFTVMDADPAALVRIGAAAGFDAVGLRIVPPFPTDRIVPVVGDAPLQREIRAAMRDTGISILDVEAFWLFPETDVLSWRPALDVAVELGARHVLAVGNDPDRGRLAANFACLCEEAAERGLRIMLEFIPYSALRGLEDAADLLAAVRPRDAGILVDALHLSRSGGHPSDLARHDAGLFSYAHLCDAPAASPPPDGLRDEARGGRLLPGEGGLWLDAFVTVFPPGTPMAVEAPNAVRNAALPPEERARLAAQAARGLLHRNDGAGTET
ncbi:sugar phosphate isomerase/epimerase family protein [Roseomonas populi]|uniref:Sugar phosphate isomerase/epimerase n=1 Tax=Roseomonas populi TaxID=3121582 RepID=A0ABT1XD01_9PROT|nr:sugar phosphate isomerase/epimerase [Roseomonas pecuniae]MCR0985599.1 sugar phosphate isomerase/epimerase [Roseomonas pecuniae]